MTTTTTPTKHVSNSRDFFLYLLMLITLVMATTSLLNTVFEFVNRLIPDAIHGNTGVSLSTIRDSLSVLIVSFPIFMGLAWFLRKDVVANPEKKELGVRKFALYFTIFVSAIVLMIDVIVLFNNFFDGELTANIFTKIAMVLVVMGGVMAYFFREVKREITSRPSRVLAWSVSAAVLAVVVLSFVIFGSPFKQRQLRIDTERIGSLSWIQQEVINYWTNSKKLPTELAQLENDITGFRVPRDNVTNLPFEYRKIDEKSFELCGVFDLPSEGLDVYSVPYYAVYPQGENYWKHEAGRQCFTRKVHSLYVSPTPAVKY